jgi:hypothetical protein
LPWLLSFQDFISCIEKVGDGLGMNVQEEELKQGNLTEGEGLVQLAAWVPDMLSDFYLVKNPKFANNLTATKAKFKKISTALESPKV